MKQQYLQNSFFTQLYLSTNLSSFLLIKQLGISDLK